MSQHPQWLLTVDPILCRAHGLCAELLPEAIDLDEWGYPLISNPLPPPPVSEAKAAVASCPSLALRLVQAAAPQPGVR